MAPDLEQSTQLSRRDFLAGLAAAAALGGSGRSSELLAQTAEVPKPPPDPVGTVSNAQVLAEKIPQMQPHSERPLTASVPAELHNFDVTPNDRMFIRNNLLTPDLDAAKQRVSVTGLVDKPVSFTLEELQRAFPVVTTQAMLECAGSGRTAFTPRPSGTPWPPTGGMGCPQWRGVRLRDVLRAAGLKSNAVHVAGQGGDFGAVATAAPVIRSICVQRMSRRRSENRWTFFQGSGRALCGRSESADGPVSQNSRGRRGGMGSRADAAKSESQRRGACADRELDTRHEITQTKMHGARRHMPPGPAFSLP